MITGDANNNVTDHIFEKIGYNLHKRPDHPLGIIKTVIEDYFDETFGKDTFTSFDDLYPIVTTFANFDSVLVNDDLSTARASIVALMKHYYPHLRSSKNPELADAMPTVSNTWRFPSLPRLLTAPWTKSVGEVPHQ